MSYRDWQETRTVRGIQCDKCGRGVVHSGYGLEHPTTGEIVHEVCKPEQPRRAVCPRCWLEKSVTGECGCVG